MKSWGILISKIIITFSNLFFLIAISIYPLFAFASEFKYNIAAFMTLITNQEPSTSNTFFNSLLENNGYVNYFILGIFLILQLTYLLPLWFLKKPFSVAMLNIYQLMINVLFLIILGFFFNWFNFSYFNSIEINGLFILLFVLFGLNFLVTFNFAVFHLAKSTVVLQEHKQSKKNDSINKNNDEVKKDDAKEIKDDENLNHEQLTNKINDLKSALKN